MMTDEEIVLSQIIQDNKIVYNTHFSICESDFQVFRNREIFKCITDTIFSGNVADILTIGTKLSKYASFIANLTSYSAANWEYYHDRIKEYSRKRSIEKLISHIDTSGSFESQVSYLMSGLQKIEADNKKPYQSISELLHTSMEDLENRIKEVSEHPGWIPGISTGYVSLDKYCFGFQPDHLYYIGARPSQGKTALACNLVLNVLDKGKNVGLLSLESSKRQIVNRIITIKSRIFASKIQLGNITSLDMSKLIDAAGRLYEQKLFIDDVPNANIDYVFSTSRAMKHADKIDILFIDYIQIIKYRDRKISRHQQLEEVSKELKELNRELGIPVVCLSQLGRDSENRKPKLSDFRYSGDLEQDADDVWFIHNDEDKTYIIIAKGRDTGTGELIFKFDRDRLLFSESY